MKNYFLVLISLFSGFLFAQNATIRGFVYDAESGEPVIFTNVFIQGSTRGAVTDVNGYYSLSKLDAGTYTIVSSSIGFDTAKFTITVKDNEIFSQRIELNASSVQLEAVEISAEYEERTTEVKMSVQKVTPKEIEYIPSVGGEKDLAQYLQVVPGVVFTGDQGGQLYIRGGSPVQNKVLLDGITIYNPFHTIGLFSVFETEAIRNAEIYTGGFNADHGNRISSVMDITTIDGNKKRISGSLGASTFGARALVSGPIKKATEEKPGTITFVSSVKHSYIDQTSTQIYNHLGEEGLPYNYTDVFGKVSFNGVSGSKFTLTGFNFNDNTEYTYATINWNAFGVGSSFILVPATSPVLIEGDFAFSNYYIEQDQTDLARSSGISGFNFGMDFTYFVYNDEIKYGFEVNGVTTDFQYTNTLNRVIGQNSNSTELLGYFKYRIVDDKFVIEPGLHTRYYASLNEISVEPRLGLKYNATDKFRLKAATGLYSQNLLTSNSDRDVVNLFNGFLLAPDNLQETFTQQNGEVRDVNSSLQRAIHYILGFEVDITKNLLWNVEGYYKDYLQLLSLNRYRLFDDTPEYQDQPEILRKDFLVEEGFAYGVDMSFKYELKNIYFWGVYSYAYVERWDGVQSYNPVYDRRNNVNLLVAYSFGEDRDWEITARWNYGSGFPFTQTQGYYESFDFSDGIGTDITTENGDLGIGYADLNGGRLPDYHRFDLNLKKTFSISSYSTLEANFGITNVYDRENIFYVDRIQGERVNQLPILPSVGLNWKF